MTRVVLVNAWHDDNKGDSAITTGVLRLVEQSRPDADVTVVGLTEGAGPTAIGSRHVARAHPEARILPMPVPTELRGKRTATPLFDVPIWLARLTPSAAMMAAGRPLAGFASLFDDADLVVGVGGSNLYSDASVHPLVSMARLFTLTAGLRTAQMMSIPTVLLGHTLGPFPRARRRTAAMARRMLSSASATVVRDPASLDVATHLGLRRAELAPDMAYAIEPAVSERVSAIVDSLPASPRRTAVIALRAHPSLGADADKRVRDELVTAAQMLRDRGLIDHVLVVAHTLGPTDIEDDRPISRALTEALRRAGVSAQYVDDDLGPEELAALYGAAGAMIAVRLHAAVLALLSGTPTFAIGYFSTKSAGVMASAGLADCVADFTDVTAEAVVSALSPRMTDPTARSRLAAISHNHRTELTRRAADWLQPPPTDPTSEHHRTRQTGDAHDART
ncbi:polysaccharide pyruvyl transferase family protein [Gordonia sp. PKS22-38]|uniref:Polysaccharide pyruvyl transferase family protein n=1 Tax=Gordonia prachuapensis TaxID=3115651 RepID=A0ABU7MZP2_9ACTN|nr:polysaccharide pyruvyl transferase family protein [Gordonia sp. PKS22-38]